MYVNMRRERSRIMSKSFTRFVIIIYEMKFSNWRNHFRRDEIRLDLCYRLVKMNVAIIYRNIRRDMNSTATFFVTMRGDTGGT